MREMSFFCFFSLEKEKKENNEIKENTMAKNDLLGGSLWDQYSNKVTTLMNNPQHQGEITEEEAAAAGHKLIVADFGAESCGDAVRL